MPGAAIDTQTIAWMRSWVENNAMPDTCNILSATLASDGMGGFTTTWGTATANVPCRLDRVNTGLETQTGGAVELFQEWVLTMPYDETISTQNRIGTGGHIYEVTGVDDDKSWPVTIRVYLEPINA